MKNKMLKTLRCCSKITNALKLYSYGIIDEQQFFLEYINSVKVLEGFDFNLTSDWLNNQYQEEADHDDNQFIQTMIDWLSDSTNYTGSLRDETSDFELENWFNEMYSIHVKSPLATYGNYHSKHIPKPRRKTKPDYREIFADNNLYVINENEDIIVLSDGTYHDRGDERYLGNVLEGWESEGFGGTVIWMSPDEESGMFEMGEQFDDFEPESWRIINSTEVANYMMNIGYTKCS
jgi:hypothetical protein